MKNIGYILVLTIGFILANYVGTRYPRVIEGIELPERVKSLYADNPVEREGDISIKVVTVNYDGEESVFLTRSYSPVTALIDGGYSVSNRNKITATSPIFRLYTNSYILVETYRTTIDEIVLTIPYETVMKGSVLCKSMAEEVVEQEGVLGLMTQRIERVYRGDTLVAEEVIEESIDREARPRIIVIQGPEDLPSSVPQRGYDCGYWEAYIDSVSATAEEKQWLKFVMKWESGCNAESNKVFFKGLYQWNPCLWYKQYPNDNIFDGTAQIRRTLEKLRAGANPNNMWPAVHRKYISTYGELSWLQ